MSWSFWTPIVELHCPGLDVGLSMCFLAEPDSCGGGGGVIHWDLHFFAYFAAFCGLWVGCHFRRGDPTFFRGLHFGVAGVSLGTSFRLHLGGSCDGLALPEFWFFGCYTFELGVRTFSTSDTITVGMSRGSSNVSCPWLKHLPPWMGFWYTPPAWRYLWLQSLPLSQLVSSCMSQPLRCLAPRRACLPLWWALSCFGIIHEGPETGLWSCAWGAFSLLTCWRQNLACT